MKKNFRISVAVAAILVLIALFFGWNTYKLNYAANVPKTLNDEFLYIPTGTTYDGLLELLKSKGFIENEESFKKCAEQQDLKTIRAGRFKITAGWGNKALVRHLKIGEQAPVKVVFNYEREISDIAGKIAKSIETDSATLMSTFLNNDYLQTKGLNSDNLMCIFLPNTYELFWNTNAEKLIEKMIKENDVFWSKNNRREKASKLLDGKGLTEKEVYILASIVEKESQNKDERPRIAGAYLNRLKINMKLQADPTCVFATKDFLTRRVTNRHLTFDSPFNTYIHTGLPPGPISIASASSIDAVLDPEQHNYIFFCAKPDNSGTHAFAETMAGHNVNVSKYISWINQRGVH
ncbi:MAG: endolytic transglycosylase MltG [Saprospiraceae bacterium]